MSHQRKPEIVLVQRRGAESSEVQMAVTGDGESVGWGAKPLVQSRVQEHLRLAQ